MPRLHGVKERRHQPFWDTLIRATGATGFGLVVAPSTLLFGNANVGNLALTNLQVPGQLASDQTYVVLALRAYLYFDGTNARANYTRVNSQLYFTLNIGDKPLFVAPCWYYPAGGGTWGFNGTAATAIYNNGEPTQEAILKLARPIMMPVRQNFNVAAQFFTVGSTDALTFLNTPATDDQRVVMFFIDGLQTRDVQ